MGIDVLPELSWIKFGVAILVNTLVPEVDLIGSFGEDCLKFVCGDLPSPADELEPDFVMDLAGSLCTLFLFALDIAVLVKTVIHIVVHVEQAQFILEGNYYVSLFDDLLEQLVPVCEVQLARNENSRCVVKIRGLEYQVVSSVREQLLGISNDNLCSCLSSILHVLLQL